MLYWFLVVVLYLGFLFYLIRYKKLEFYISQLSHKLEEKDSGSREIVLEDIDFSDENFLKLKENIQQLLSALQIAVSFGKKVSLLSKKKIFSAALDEVLNYLTAENISILLYDEKNKVLKLQAVRGINSPEGEIELSPGEGLAGWAFQNNISVISNLGYRDSRFKRKNPTEKRIRNIICSPIISKSTPVGVLNVVNKLPAGSQFTRFDLMLIEIISQQLGILLEEEELFEEYMLKQVMEKEIFIAKSIQNMYLNNQFPEHPSLKIELFYETSKQLGGDLYFSHYYPETDKYWIFLGDVSGKSVPASLIVASSITIFELLTSEKRVLDEIPSLANNVLFKILKDDFYLTLLLMELDFSKNKLTFINCGNERPLIKMKNWKIEEVPISGFPLGLFENLEFEKKSYDFQDIDTVYLYSDGVLELFFDKDDKNILKSLERLKKSLRENEGKEIEFFQSITTKSELDDDTTFIKVKIEEGINQC